MSSHYQVIRPIRGPQGTQLPSPNFIMRLNVWHMHCWHNKPSLTLLSQYRTHVWCGSDAAINRRNGRDRLWTSAGKIQENNCTCVQTEGLRTQARSQSENHKNNITLPHAYTPPTPLPVNVLDQRTHIYIQPQHISPQGLPFQAVDSHSPLKGSWTKKKFEDTRVRLTSWMRRVLSVC